MEKDMRIKLAGLLLALGCFANQDGHAQATLLHPGTGHSLPIASPALATPFFIAPQTVSPGSGSIAGDWNGVLDAQGTKLRLILHIKKNPDGTFAATIDSPDQGANGIPVSAVDQTGKNVKLELAKIAAGYQGKLNTAGTEITGEWKQGGGALPLTFKRVRNKASVSLQGLPATTSRL
jgi:hypothetical protein